MPAPISLTSPLPPEDLLFESMSCSEGLSVLGEMQLGLVSAKPDLKPQDLLGKTLGVTVQLRDDAKRHFHGYVTRFSIGARSGRYYGYQASVRPWLWFLTRTTDCRIFQDLSVPDIVKKVFEDHGGASFKFNLYRTYRKWVYCVQYRESDYNFVARLLEHEGIYWYVEHGEGQHKVVLVDSKSVHDAAPGCTPLPYYENTAEAPPDTECIGGWQFASAVETDHTLLRSYDFERPSTPLEVKAEIKPPYKIGALEQYDWQGDYVQASDGQQWAEARLDEQQTRYETARGSTNAHGIEAGRLLTLERHPRENQNAEYLVTQATVHARNDAYETGGSAGSWQCEFSAIPSGQQFRPQRRTPKPFVQGPQTAVVSGPAGEELFTDKYGRVKVQFHWDRYGTKDEKSSCWVRVSQPWAGKGWGGVSIPRIGQEVVVDFLEGDPDQPLVTGRVYNAEQSPPYPLPEGAVMSGIKSKSHKASGYNELSMDDTAGKEKITIHGQYDMGTTVLHDQTTTVHNCRTDTVDVDDAETVGSNQSLTVGADQSIAIGANRTETVGANESITIGAHRTETVNGGETVTVNGGRTHTVSGMQSTSISIAETHTVGAGRMHSVGAAEAINVGGLQTVTVGGARMVSVGGPQKVNVGALQSVTVGGAHSLSASAISESAKSVFKIKAGSICQVEAPTIVLKAGGSTITMKGSGISIKGAKITIEASGTGSFKAGGSLKIKGSNLGED